MTRSPKFYAKKHNGKYRWLNAGGHTMMFDGEELTKYDPAGNKMFPNRDDFKELEKLKERINGRHSKI